MKYLSGYGGHLVRGDLAIAIQKWEISWNKPSDSVEDWHIENWNGRAVISQAVSTSIMNDRFDAEFCKHGEVAYSGKITIVGQNSNIPNAEIFFKGYEGLKVH